MLVIALTGGIGSGKTTVANLFAKLGVSIIDADTIARELIAPGQPAFNEILNHFDQSILTSNGMLDRTKLRHIIFDQPAERDWLEELLHPLVRKKIADQVQQCNGPYCIAVIPLLSDAKSYPFIKRVLVVDASEAAQIERVVARDNSTQERIEAVLKIQEQRAGRLQKADDIIINDGIIEDLVPQVEKLHQQYLKLTK